MRIFAIDTALGRESCAIMDNGKIIGFSEGHTNSLQAEKLFEHITRLFKETDLSYADMDYFAADIGPGSFTGIRIGLSAVLGICLALEKQFIGVSSLEALAFKALPQNGNIIHVALNAGRDEAYMQSFTLNTAIIKTVSDGELINLTDIKMADVGNLPVCTLNTVPDARDIALAAHMMLQNNMADFGRKAPIYIRKPDAKINTRLNNVLKTN